MGSLTGGWLLGRGGVRLKRPAWLVNEKTAAPDKMELVVMFALVCSILALYRV